MVNKYAVFLFIFFLSFVFLPIEVSAQSTDSARQRIAEQKQKIQQTIIESRQEAKASREAVMKTKREAFQQKVAAIKDERKKQLIQRIDTKLSTVNTNRTNKMTENLEKLSVILAKIKEKAVIAKENGKDTSSIDTAIAKAETAIQNAKSAVAAQTDKEYVITITATGSGQLKNSVGTITKQLQADLSASHKLMIAAKQAVQQAHLALTKILVIPIAPESTISATKAAQ